MTSSNLGVNFQQLVYGIVHDYAPYSKYNYVLLGETAAPNPGSSTCWTGWCLFIHVSGSPSPTIEKWANTASETKTFTIWYI